LLYAHSRAADQFLRAERQADRALVIDDSAERIRAAGTVWMSTSPDGIAMRQTNAFQSTI
jgi:hypothetical protein